MDTTGRTPRRIQITVSDMDAFSDDVKIGGLIDEIEIAEAKAKKALLEEQIKSSQPSKFSLKINKLKKAASGLVADVKEGVASLKERIPKEPKLARVRAAKRAEKAERRAERMADRQTAKMAKLEARKTRISVLERINSLAPGGVSQKGVIVSVLTAIAVVVASELGIWAFTHPITQTEVPKTGFIAPEEESTETVGAPETTEQATTSEIEEKTSEEQSGIAAPAATTTRRATTVKKTNGTATGASNNSKNSGKTYTDSNEIYIDSSLSGNEVVVPVEESEQKVEEPTEEKATEDEANKDTAGSSDNSDSSDNSKNN